MLIDVQVLVDPHPPRAALTVDDDEAEAPQRSPSNLPLPAMKPGTRSKFA